MTQTPKQVLEQLKFDAMCKDYPNVPTYAIPATKYTDKTANGLTKMIIDFLQLSGWQAERISTTGRYVDNSKVVENVLGQKKQIGSGQWIKGSGKKGSADISATIKGRSVKIEVKIGRDRQSKDQLEYQKQIERSGGVYIIAKNFNDFYDWYKNFLPTI